MVSLSLSGRHGSGYRLVVTFDVAADAYASFMGRFATPLADQFVDLVGPAPGSRVLDVGCGPGTVTAVLVDRLGADRVAAVDPSPSFVTAVRERLPDVDVREGTAEDLPYADATFDAAVSQLVVPFMADPVRGLSEMRRVVRPGGIVAACAWDFERGPFQAFWRAAEELAPGALAAIDLAGAREGQLAELMTAAGLEAARSTALTVHVAIATFEEWWEPFAHRIGPAGEYFASLAAAEQSALRARCAELLPCEPVEITGVARAATARRP
jgi:SAM-dependent methyltransferase